MSAPTLIPIALERAGLLFATVALKAEKKVWIWLSSGMVEILNRDCPAKWLYQLRDPELSTLECRYPRYVLGYTDSMCGRRPRGSILGEDVLVEAQPLLRLMDDVWHEWSQTVGASALRELVREAAAIKVKGSGSRANHGKARIE